MAVRGKRVCRLCLEITPPCESEPIEAAKKEILKVLLINMDFEISDYAVACNRCVELLQDCFEFKSYVVNSFMDVDLKVDIKEEDFQSQARSHKSSQVCRLCMSLIGDESLNHTVVWKNGVLLKDMMRCCFPKMDLNTAHEPIICKQCLSNVSKYYEFMKSCQDVEQKIEHFCQVVGRGAADNKVILEDMLKFKDYDVIDKQLVIKKECTDAEFVDVNAIKCLKNEEADNICEEIDIKDELDTRAETNDPDQSENLGKDAVSKTDGRTRKNAWKGRKHFCPKCDYSAKKNWVMKKHILSHSGTEVHRCILCNFVTDTSLSLQAHMARHRGPTKRYGCHECPYETEHRRCLAQHLLKHKDNVEVKMYKCPSCLYQTKYEGALKTHQELHHQDNVEMYNCELCSYSTKHKESLRSHQESHKEPQVIPKHKCEMCDYETNHKGHLTNHMRVHEDPNVANKFHCEKCPYKSKWRSTLNKHMLSHSNEQPYSCDQCTFSTKVSANLRVHKRVHQKDGEGRYKCKLCSYHARTSGTLKEHMIMTHTDPSEVPNLKCAHCPYETILKRCLSMHVRRCQGNENRLELKCDLCDYVTKDKGYLQKHSFVHREATIQCDQCDFMTKQKRRLRLHMKRHQAGSSSSTKKQRVSLGGHTKKENADKKEETV